VIKFPRDSPVFPGIEYFQSRIPGLNISNPESQDCKMAPGLSSQSCLQISGSSYSTQRWFLVHRCYWNSNFMHIYVLCNMFRLALNQIKFSPLNYISCIALINSACIMQKGKPIHDGWFHHICLYLLLTLLYYYLLFSEFRIINIYRIRKDRKDIILSSFLGFC